jgi:hypothetical protein
MPLDPPALIKLFIHGLNNKEFIICHFRDKAHRCDAPLHYRVFVPINDESYVLLCLITSKVQKRKDYYHGDENFLRSLIELNKNDLKFLREDSVIDCNRAELMSKGKLFSRISMEDIFEIKCNDHEIPNLLKKRIIGAINCSPMIKPEIKKLLAGRY